MTPHPRGRRVNADSSHTRNPPDAHVRPDGLLKVDPADTRNDRSWLSRNSRVFLQPY